MANRFLETLSFAGSGTKKTLNPGDLTISEGDVAKGVELRISLPIKNNGAGAILGTLTKALTYALKTFSLAFGKEKALTLWSQEIGSNLLLAHRWAYGSIPAVATSGSLAASYFGGTGLAAGGTETLTFWARIPFEAWRMLNRKRLAVGYSQFKTLFFENQTGQPTDLDASGNIVQNGNMSIDLVAPVDEGDDVVSPAIAWRKNARTGLWVALSRGLPLMLAETSSGFAGTALDLVNLFVGDMHNEGDRVKYIQDYHQDTLGGTSDISDTVTMLLELMPNTEFLRQPSGPIKVTQPTSEEATLNIAGLIVPDMDENIRAGIAAEIARQTEGNFHLVNRVAAHSIPDVPVRSLDYAGYLLARPGDPTYDAYDAENYGADGTKTGLYKAPTANAGKAAVQKISKLSSIPGVLGKSTSPAIRKAIVRPPHFGAV